MYVISLRRRNMIRSGDQGHERSRGFSLHGSMGFVRFHDLGFRGYGNRFAGLLEHG